MTSARHCLSRGTGPSFRPDRGASLPDRLRNTDRPKETTMIKPLAAAVLSLGIGLAPASAAPARAGDRPDIAQPDIAQILGALALLGIAGKAYGDYRDRKDADKDAERAARSRPSDRAAPAWDRDRDRDWDRDWDRARGRHGGRDGHRDRGARRDRTLPAGCGMSVDARHGPSRVYGKRCLERRGLRTERLPRGCETWARVGNRWRGSYGARCLEAKGWREARHRD